MASRTNTTRTPSALAAVILAALIGLVPIAAAILASAPSAEVARWARRSKPSPTPGRSMMNIEWASTAARGSPWLTSPAHEYGIDQSTGPLSL